MVGKGGPGGPGRRQAMAIGLDGLTLDLLLPLARSGRLPTFARLLGEGAWGPLRSVGNTMTGPTWASFATGAEPQEHGVLHDYHHDDAGYALRQTTGADVRLPGLWTVASEAGRQVIVLNVPHTYPAPPVTGVLLAGIDAPSSAAPGFDHPVGAYSSLVQATGDYLIDCGCQAYLQAASAGSNADATARAKADVTRETEGRTRAAEHLARQLDWDLLVVVYSLPDIWQHYFWHTSTGTAADPASGIVAAGYEQIDRHLARLLALLPDDGLAVVFSDHGFGPATGCRQRLNDWLAEQGLLSYRDGRRGRASRRAFAALLAAARRHTSYAARQRLLSALPALQTAVDSRLNIGDIDWARTSAYAAMDHLELWLNLRGRQPVGIVGANEADEVLDRVRTLLLDWRDPVTGSPYVRSARRRPYHGAGPDGAIAPDLAIDWDPETAPPDAHPTMSGDHQPDGAILVRGRGVERGKIAGARLTGVAPLLLDALDVPVPSWMAVPVDVPYMSEQQGATVR